MVNFFLVILPILRRESTTLHRILVAEAKIHRFGANSSVNYAPWIHLLPRPL
jgi:hypothetical protein